jgi:nucleotide-binding universal stress UspA family protein
MFKTIVLALDGSEGSKKAIPVAAELAEKEGANIVIAHVTEYLAAKGASLPAVNEDEIRADIEEEAKALSDRGIKTDVKNADVVLGGPAPAIVDIADQAGGDMIVTGTRGHGAIAGVLVGSVAHRLLSIGKRPTLAVPS